jgi:hypothetical protein
MIFEEPPSRSNGDHQPVHEGTASAACSAERWRVAASDQGVEDDREARERMMGAKVSAHSETC